MKHVYYHHIHRAKVGLPIEDGKVSLFPETATDDEWMSFVAQKGWIAFTQDYALHRQPAVLSLIKQHGAKVFYLGGAEATKFEAMRGFMAQYPKMLEITKGTPGPFIFRMKLRGQFEQVQLP